MLSSHISSTSRPNGSPVRLERTTPFVENAPNLVGDLYPHSDELSSCSKHGAYRVAVETLYPDLPIPARLDDLGRSICSREPVGGGSRNYQVILRWLVGPVFEPMLYIRLKVERIALLKDSLILWSAHDYTSPGRHDMLAGG